MNEKDFVTLEVAKLLKEKGFNEECYAYYRNGVLIYAMYQDYSSINDMLYQYILNDKIYTPTLYQAQKWLRDKHNIHITIGNSASGYWWELSKADNGTTIYDYNYSGPNDGGKWDTYEEALICGILKAILCV